MPVVLQSAPKLFDYIVQALEAQTLTGENAKKVVEAGKMLVQASGLSMEQVAAALTPERQLVAKQYFS